MTISFEVCVDSIESCIEAIKGGASRLELCSSLFSGGLTPSYGMMKLIKKKKENGDELFKNIKIHIMIRPRGGDFLYSDEEFECMKNDIEIVKELGCFDGVVFGCLKGDGTIDKEKTQELVTLSLPLSVTFHRAFDMVRDHKEAFDILSSINGIDRILTSGLDSSVLEGIDTIRQLIQLSKDTNIKILPGGGINQKNVKKIIKKTQPLKEYHISGRSQYDSQMKFRNNKVFMGGALRESEFTLSIVDKNKINDFINQSNK